jgi:hypothetical protein
MAKVTRDIIGSTLSVNDDFREDKATRRVFVKLTDSDAGGTTRAGTAILKAIENQSSHPENACSAPLRNATAKQVGSDTFEVVLQYYHTRARFGNPTTLFSMQAVPGERSPQAWVYKSVWNRGDGPNATPNYDSYGLPDGDTLFPPGSSVAVARLYREPWFLPCFRLVVNGKINAGLAASIQPTLTSAGIVNDNSFVYGNLTFPANSLRFDTMSIDYVDEQPNNTGGLYYYLSYIFTYCPSGFVTQRIREQANGVAAVETANVFVGPPRSFAGLFPGI